MHHAFDVLAALVQRAVDGEAGGVDFEAVVVDGPSFDVDLHQARCGDFVEEPAVGVDQELVMPARHAHRDMGVDQVGQLELRCQAIGRGQLHAHFPFGVADIARLAVGMRVGGGNHREGEWGVQGEVGRRGHPAKFNRP
ncbi:hypothetical protein D3C78_1439820 [compost metagenome]